MNGVDECSQPPSTEDEDEEAATSQGMCSRAPNIGTATSRARNLQYFCMSDY